MINLIMFGAGNAVCLIWGWVVCSAEEPIMRSRLHWAVPAKSTRYIRPCSALLDVTHSRDNREEDNREYSRETQTEDTEVETVTM